MFALQAPGCTSPPTVRAPAAWAAQQCEAALLSMMAPADMSWWTPSVRSPPVLSKWMHLGAAFRCSGALPTLLLLHVL